MGYNTTLVILNDALCEIEKDNNFGKKIADAIRKFNYTKKTIDISSNSHCNAAIIIEWHHADQTKLIAVGGNCGQDLGYVGNGNIKKIEILKAFANSLNYKIIKKSIKNKKVNF